MERKRKRVSLQRTIQDTLSFEVDGDRRTLLRVELVSSQSRVVSMRRNVYLHVGATCVRRVCRRIVSCFSLKAKDAKENRLRR